MSDDRDDVLTIGATLPLIVGVALYHPTLWILAAGVLTLCAFLWRRNTNHPDWWHEEDSR